MKIQILKLVGELGLELKKHKFTLVTAESCTGGGLSYYISSNPQSSSILERGFITYSNQSKEELLEVKNYSIQIYGAVSEQVAKEMAEGALKNSSAQIAISITGLAGSDKCAEEKGVVWICCTNNFHSQQIKKKYISGTRSQFIEKVILESIKELLTYINKIKNR